MKHTLIFILGLIFCGISCDIAYTDYSARYEVLALFFLWFGGLFMYYAMLLWSKS